MVVFGGEKNFLFETTYFVYKLSTSLLLVCYVSNTEKLNM